MTKITVEIGHNVRTWTTFTIVDATPEEAALFAGDDEDEMISHLKSIFESERVLLDSVQRDSNPSYFDEGDEPALITADVRADG